MSDVNREGFPHCSVTSCTINCPSYRNMLYGLLTLCSVEAPLQLSLNLWNEVVLLKRHVIQIIPNFYTVETIPCYSGTVV